MSLTNSQVYSIYQVISKYDQRTDLHVKFAWALMRTKKRIKPLMDSLAELQQPAPEMTAYENKRIALCEQYSEKEEDGSPKVENNAYVIPEDKREELDKKVIELKEGDFANLFATEKTKAEQMKALMEEDSDIELFQVNIDFVSDGIAPGDLDILEPMILDGDN